MTVEIGLIFGLIACIIGIAGFLGGRLAAAKRDGTEWGEFKGDLTHIKNDVAELKQLSLASSAEVKQSISRVYDRMDERFKEHIKNYHQGG
jgi:hypothetical protein